MKQVWTQCLRQEVSDHILLLTLNASNSHNPFSAELEREVTSALNAACVNDEIRAVVITGGKERSFSVGGDFNEVKEFEGGSEVDRWIDDIIGMYIACLEIRKPTVAAVDNYAIGIGFQLALCCDYRLGTPQCQLIMPELRNGVACILGQYMLERMLGRAQMQRIVIECDRIGPEENLRLGLLNSLCEPDALLVRSHEIAMKLVKYPRVAYEVTKQEMNLGFIEGLRRVTPIAKTAHRATFKDRAAQTFMNKILNK